MRAKPESGPIGSDQTVGGGRRPVERAWFTRPAVELAPDILGAVLVSSSLEGVVAVRITEVEAYEGADDPGSHAFSGRTRRNEVMFGRAGHLYVYFTYGMHWCANVVCGPKGKASAVLLRAGEVISGLAVARSRRPAARNDNELARGPARLASTLALGPAHNGLDLCDPDSGLALHPSGSPPGRISTGPRVGLARAADRPWRYWITGDPTVSPYRPHTPRRRATL